MGGAGGRWVGWRCGDLGIVQPKASSSGDSRGVPQTRQMTAEQSPQTSGSATGRAHTGHHIGCGADRFWPGGWGGADILTLSVANMEGTALGAKAAPHAAYRALAGIRAGFRSADFCSHRNMVVLFLLPQMFTMQ
jgi:hypothetical protein